ncbi:MAG: hypothetical protein DME76_10325 [Verrucomicrobia bacterium]|nr:MAG: hypothetical protein DME76_10325 [Verrucomicrobiota bacterium]
MIYQRSYDLPSSMILYGFTDLVPEITYKPDECPQCETALRVNNGLCLLCLLRVGLTEHEDFGSESLEMLLSEIE